jgi:hypothetical protein
VLFLFLLVILECSLVDSLKDSFTRTSSTPFGEILAKSFGCAVGGIINVDYDITPASTLSTSTTPYNSYFILLVVNEDQRSSFYSQIGSASDSLIAANIDTYCTLPSLTRRVIQSVPASGSFNFTVTSSHYGNGRYSVLAFQCRQLNSTYPLRTHVHVESKNPLSGTDSSDYSQLPIQSVMLVRFYLGEIIIYGLLLIGILGQIYVAK